MRSPIVGVHLSLLSVAASLAGCGDDGATSQGTGTLTSTATGIMPSGSGTETTSVGSSGTSITPTTTQGDSESNTTPASDSTTGTGTTAEISATDPDTDTTQTSMTTQMRETDASSGSGPGSSSSSGGMPCPDGTIVCEGNDKKVCDGVGGFKDEESCTGFCLAEVGCVVCEPDSFTCEGDKVLKCDDQGGGYGEFETCDPIQGTMCDEQMGGCAGDCAPVQLGTSYIGCDYYPTVTAGLKETNPWVFDFAVVVANTTAKNTNITVTRGANVVVNDMVGPNTAKVIKLPYVNELSISPIGTQGPTLKLADGAYRLRSDSPVTVYQYQPLQYKVGNAFSYINDAGLLLPVNTWGQDFRVASRNHWSFGQFQIPGFYAVTAKEDGTQVTLTPSATGNKVFAGAGVAADGTGVVMLDQGDVLEVFTQAKGGSPDGSDLTGTRVESSKPVQVIGGHKCTNVPVNVQFCDRIEESIPPIDVLSKEYIVTAPLISGNTKKGEMVRIIATEANTALTYDPPQGGAPALLVNAGDYAEIAQTQADFKITGDKKILVAQYFLGQNAGGNSGDPAMAIAVTTEQFRTQYLIHAPTNYDTSFANIVAPPGANVTLDGAPVGGFAPIGGTGFSVARVPLSNAGDGNHLFDGDQKFGVMIYGYGQYTSYWYPGGLDLNSIPQ